VLITSDDPSVGKHNLGNFKELKVVTNFPIVLEAGGLKLTVHDVYLYKADSEEAKVLHKKYDFQYFGRAKYVVWSKISLENTSKKVIRYDGLDLNEKVGWFTATSETHGRLLNSNSITYGTMNNTEVLDGWILKPSESITSTNVQIDYLSEKPFDTIGVFLSYNNATSNKLIAVGKE